MVEGNELRYLLKKFSSNAQEKDDEVNILEGCMAANSTRRVKVYSPLVTQRIVLLDHLHIYQTKKQIDDVLYFK
jgi:hypothetical protein